MTKRRASTSWWVAALAVTVLADVLMTHPADGPWWHQTAGSFALLGLGGTVLLVLGANTLGRYWLQRREGHGS